MKKATFIITAISFIIFSCSKDEYSIDNLNDKIFVLGHGGMGVGRAQYPLDSYEGIEKAISMGADGSEFDIQITKDSVLVCFHDHYLEEATFGSGEIYTRNWDEIKDSEYKGTPYTNYKICSLDWLFEHIDAENKKFTLDIKFHNPDQSAANRDIFQRALIRVIEKYHIEANTTLESPDPDFLETLQAKKSDLNLFIYSDVDSAMNTAKQLGLQGITVKAEEISAEQVTDAHNNGLLVAVFSTTRRNHDEVIKKNVDIIQTDDLEDLLARLK
jgi:glycerophosphoryl diester phosphodiesterase